MILRTLSRKLSPPSSSPLSGSIYRTRIIGLMRNIRWHNWAVFTLLALLIFGPLLARGYILTLDLSWGPHLGPVTLADNGWALHQLLSGLVRIFPSWVVEKLLLLSIFILAGVGASKVIAGTAPGPAAIIGGILYCVNPFT